MLRSGKRWRERGSAIVCTMAVTVVCAGVATAMISRGMGMKRQYDATWARAVRLELAQAGIADSVFALSRRGSGVLRACRAPPSFRAGGHSLQALGHAHRTVNLTS